MTGFGMSFLALGCLMLILAYAVRGSLAAFTVAVLMAAYNFIQAATIL